MGRTDAPLALAAGPVNEVRARRAPVGLMAAGLLAAVLGMAHAEPVGARQTAVAVAVDAAAAASTFRAAAFTLPPETQAVLDWVRETADHQAQPFALIDKRQATLWLFDAAGRLTGQTPVLLGAARGDHSVPGIGERPMAQIRPHERTTPAGRFVAEVGHNAKGEDIFWIDYDAAVSMHRVRALVPSERRLQRLASASPRDNRISYGCINVPVRFYEQVLQPAFQGSRAVVYVLPETEPAAAWLQALRKR